MGAAKRRGTMETRVAQAQERDRLLAEQRKEEQARWAAKHSEKRGKRNLTLMSIMAMTSVMRGDFK